jgi:hypothetical protein
VADSGFNALSFLLPPVYLSLSLKLRGFLQTLGNVILLWMDAAVTVPPLLPKPKLFVL